MALLISASIGFSCFPTLEAEDIPALSAKSAAIMSEEGDLLYGLEPDLMLPIASTTKLMTALVVIENVDLDVSEEIRPEWCGAEGSSMYLRPGDRYTIRELLTGLLLASGNDAAIALANICAGDPASFVAMMNDRAKTLGMRNTHFLNPHGLNEAGHYSTARDLGLLMCEVVRAPVLRGLLGLRSADVGGQTLINHNKLLLQYPGCIGGKTGYTQVAGRCLVTCAEREGTRFVCVTLSDPDDWNDQVHLYDWAFSHFEQRNLGSAELNFDIPVLGGAERSVSAVPVEEISLLVPREQELTVHAELPYYVFAPVVGGDRAGSVSVYLGDTLLAESPLIYAEDVPNKQEHAMQERLQKIIAAAGKMSRRAAEEAIRSGRVSVNGRTASLGEKADPDSDDIRLDGIGLSAPEKKVYLMLHKPRGVVTTLSDEKGRRTVAQLVSGLGVRVYPVGRLDLDSEGLLLMTNDGDFAMRLTHPSHEVEKTYLTWVDGENIRDSAQRLSLPMTIDGCALHPAKIRFLRETGDHEALLSVMIHEGRNRQVRKMCEAVGLRVRRLVRVREGSLELGGLPPGKWRFLTQEEIDSFQ